MSGYIGRFAPSPTGPLHAGSLLTAVASYLDARAHQGEWRLRMDDLDTPRLQSGADEQILRALEGHGLLWDGPVLRQSDRIDAYLEQLEVLRAQNRLFYCRCSRRSLRDLPVYPGTCRAATKPSTDVDEAVRIAVETDPIRFTDAVCGQQATNLAVAGGDFIIWRKDGIAGYQLATAVDDGLTGITQVVRGNDLLSETPRQLFLIRCFGGQIPQYAHLPVLVDRHGVKLSKQAGAQPIALDSPSKNLWQVLDQLALAPPKSMAGAPAIELLQWGVSRWRLPNHAPDAQVAVSLPQEGA